MSIEIQTQKPAIMGVPRTFEVWLEKEGGVDLAFHQNRARSGKPAIELFRPSTEQHLRGRQHGASEIRRNRLDERSGGVTTFVIKSSLSELRQIYPGAVCVAE